MYNRSVLCKRRTSQRTAGGQAQITPQSPWQSPAAPRSYIVMQGTNSGQRCSRYQVPDRGLQQKRNGNAYRYNHCEDGWSHQETSCRRHCDLHVGRNHSWHGLLGTLRFSDQAQQRGKICRFCDQGLRQGSSTAEGTFHVIYTHCYCCLTHIRKTGNTFWVQQRHTIITTLTMNGWAIFCYSITIIIQQHACQQPSPEIPNKWTAYFTFYVTIRTFKRMYYNFKQNVKRQPLDNCHKYSMWTLITLVHCNLCNYHQHLHNSKKCFDVPLQILRLSLMIIIFTNNWLQLLLIHVKGSFGNNDISTKLHEQKMLRHPV